MAAALDSPSYCSNCGAGVKAALPASLVLSIATVVGFAVGFAASSVTLGVLAGLFISCIFLVLPLKAADNDPIAYRRKLHAAAAEQREDLSDR
jgi:hypothetical protein